MYCSIRVVLPAPLAPEMPIILSFQCILSIRNRVNPVCTCCSLLSDICLSLSISKFPFCKDNKNTYKQVIILMKITYKKVNIYWLFNNIEVILKKLSKFNRYRSSAETVNTRVTVTWDRTPCNFIHHRLHRDHRDLHRDSYMHIAFRLSKIIHLYPLPFLAKPATRNLDVRPNFLSINQISLIIFWLLPY